MINIFNLCTQMNKIMDDGEITCVDMAFHENGYVSAFFHGKDDRKLCLYLREADNVAEAFADLDKTKRLLAEMPLRDEEAETPEEEAVSVGAEPEAVS